LRYLNSSATRTIQRVRESMPPSIGYSPMIRVISNAGNIGRDMTEAHTTDSVGHHDDRSLTFEMAARLSNLAMIRTVVGAATTVDDIDMDTVADLKLATDEACTRLIKASVPDATLTVRLDFHPDRLNIAVHTHCLAGDVFPLDSFSWYVLNSLVDHVETFERSPLDDPVGRVVGVAMSAQRDAPAAVHVAHG
jgi:serine/threonine-protein kinase RsbW